MPVEHSTELSGMATLDGGLDANAAPLLQEGCHFGAYRIIRCLGQGGMGEVYEAEHHLLQKHFALKILHRKLAASSSVLSHFQEEARLMASLQHPNIIRIDDFGETDGLLWLRMELAKGGSAGEIRVHSLAEYADMNGRRLDLEEVENAFRQILSGLSFIHARGLVHGDLKPANILIDSNYQGLAVFKISDCGVVRMIGDESVQKLALASWQLSRSLGDQSTQAAALSRSALALLGTYENMSPEQKSGKAAVPASDLYAVGLMLYRLLTGVEIGLRPPSHYVQALPPAWDDFILKALEEMPDARFSDAGAMLAAMPAMEVPAPAPALEPVVAAPALVASETPLSEKSSALRVQAVPESPTQGRLVPILSMDDKPETRHRFRGLRKAMIMLLLLGIAFVLLWRYAGLQLVEARADASATRDPDAFRVPPGFQAVSEEREPYSGSGWAKEVIHSKSGIVMVFIPPGMGTVTIREENERGKFAIPRPVKIAKGFYLSKYEVTQRQWSGTMHYSPSKFHQSALNLTRPVESVSWDDCQKFCQTLGDGFRLPTEAEWEYACRAGTTTTYHYGASLDAKLANFFHTYPDRDPGKDGYHGATLPVGQYLPNLWGLYDMHGNVAEWCQDPFGKFPGKRRPSSPSSDPDWFRVTRGGSWGSEASDCASECRSWCGQDQRSGSVGFRVARTAM